MTMQSVNLLPALRELPGTAYDRRKSFRDMMADLVNTDRAMYAAEFTAATSFGLWAIFDSINVDDRLLEAYETRWPEMSDHYSLYENFQQLSESGESTDWLVSGLKGQLAEFAAAERYTQAGGTVILPDSATQPGYDFQVIWPGGEEVFVQVKTGAAERAGEIQQIMNENPDFIYALGTEIHDQIAESAPELVERIIDIGPDYALVADITDGLGTLSDNLGIDVPDGIGEIVPYAGAIITGARLIYGALRTEREFKAADRTTRNKIQVVQALTLMSRMGVTTVLATVGGMGGTAAGSAVPFVGNLIGGIVGSVAGAGMGMYLNRHLRPHMLNLALDITGLTNDDLFYYKNKPRIDQVAWNFRQTAGELATAPISGRLR